MKKLEVEAPLEHVEEVEEVVSDYSSEFSKSETDRDGDGFVEFNITTKSESIDDLTDELKGLKDIDSGKLSIRVFEQESLIKKGQKTKGSRTSLSKQEIFSKAQEFKGFDSIQWLLICVSAALAAYGLVFDNVIIVIGAMIFAPLLSPLVSVSISLVVGDSSMMKQSVLSSLKAFFLVVFVAYLVLIPVPVTSNELIQMIVEPGIVSPVLSILVGSAAALTFASGIRDQVAGVAVAIALVPPLASVGVGLRMVDSSVVLGSLAISSINILSVVIAGFATFYLIGLRPSSYYSQKKAEKMRKILGLTLFALILVAGGILYTSYGDYQDYLFEQQLEQEAEEFFGDNVLEIRQTSEGYQVIVLDDQDLDRERTFEGAEVVFLEVSDG